METRWSMTAWCWTQSSCHGSEGWKAGRLTLLGNYVNDDLVCSVYGWPWFPSEGRMIESTHAHCAAVLFDRRMKCQSSAQINAPFMRWPGRLIGEGVVMIDEVRKQRGTHGGAGLTRGNRMLRCQMWTKNNTQMQSLIVDLILCIDCSVVHILPPAGTKTSILSFPTRPADALIYCFLSRSKVTNRCWNATSSLIQ